jgi:hypothetical protein
VPRLDRSRGGRSWSVLTRQRSVPQVSAREIFVGCASVGAARRAAVAARGGHDEDEQSPPAEPRLHSNQRVDAML